MKGQTGHYGVLLGTSGCPVRDRPWRRGRSALGDQPQPRRLPAARAAVGRAERDLQVGEVALHRALRHPQEGRDGRQRESFGQQVQEGALAVGERRGRRRLSQAAALGRQERPCGSASSMMAAPARGRVSLVVVIGSLLWGFSRCECRSNGLERQCIMVFARPNCRR